MYVHVVGFKYRDLPVSFYIINMCACVYYSIVLQDLSKLGRDITQCVIIDNSPQSYIFHPDNAVSYKSTLLFKGPLV